MSELKLFPCPFCGGESLVKTHARGFQVENLYRIVCSKCHVSQTWKNNSNAAIKAWNKRVTNDAN